MCRGSVGTALGRNNHQNPSSGSDAIKSPYQQRIQKEVISTWASCMSELAAALSHLS